MRLWLLKASEPTPYDAQVRGSRLFRYGMLVEKAVELGHEVVWWTDDFDHFHKAHRFGEDRCILSYPGCTIQFIHTPGYRRNTSLRRLRDHRLLAHRFEQMARGHPRPDLILAGMPTDSFCVSAVRVGRRYGVPVVLDVRDLWPDVFYSRTLSIVHPLLSVLVRPVERRVGWAFARADAIIGNTKQFVEWGLRKGRRSWSPADKVVPIGFRQPRLDDIEIVRGFQFWESMGIRPDDEVFRVCFFGSIGPMFDFQPVLEAARALAADHPPVQFVLCGMGSKRDRLLRSVVDLDNVLLPGWVNVEQMATLMKMSHLGIAPYRDIPNFRMNLPNKPAEYLSAQLPYLTSVGGVMHELARDNRCGERYLSTEELVYKIRAYRDDPVRLRRERRNAKIVFDKQLNANVVYTRLLKHFETLIRSSD